MDTESIIKEISGGMVLRVPKEHLRKLDFRPVLFAIPYAREIRQEILLKWEEVDELLDMKILPNTSNRLCKAEKEDIVFEGRVIKIGWKNNGWDGENFDYYRMVQ